MYALLYQSLKKLDGVYDFRHWATDLSCAPLRPDLAAWCRENDLVDNDELLTDKGCDLLDFIRAQRS